jgi:aspartyl-tRNA(Asn)/glutamyl-tRNA(Gln) amidotransferase subunit A
MPMSELMNLSACELAAAVRRGEISPVDTVTACLERLEHVEPRVNAFVHVCAERALGEARAMEAEVAACRDPGPLAGVPLAVKDLEDVGGLPTTYGSVPFRDHVAREDSVQVARLRAAGAIVVGKTNTPEFGYTAFTRNLLFGVTRNPWNLDRTPGGSSGGSAAAVAARMVPLATGSDGGGSIRIPACYVGAFGMKPTFGRIPVGAGVSAMQYWIDTVHYGPLARTVADAAVYLDVAAGYHPSDPTSLPKPTGSYSSALARDPGRLRVAFSPDLGYAIVQDDVMREVRTAVDVFRSLGHEVTELELTLPDLGRGWSYLSGAEGYAEIVDLVEGKEEQLGRGFWKGLVAASRLTAAETGRIQRDRHRLNQALASVFGSYDLLLTPTLPTEAFDAKGPMPSAVAGRAFASPMHAVAFTYPFNCSGHPAATVRAGLTDGGLPAGLQIMAERHRDDLVLQAAGAYERMRPWTRWPEP